MTCIVGIVSDKIWIGGDSAASGDGTVILRKDEKVFKRDQFLYGYAGSFRLGQLLRYKFNPPTKRSKRQDIYEYMVSEWMDSLRKCLKDSGYTKILDENHEEIEASFLVGYKGRLFIVDEDLNVGETLHSYIAIGSGEPYALGSLNTTDKIKNMDPEKRIQLALEAAAEMSTGVRPPFHILSI